MHPHGHIPDIIGDPGNLRRFPGIFRRHLGGGDQDVGINISLEQAAVLCDGSDPAPQRMEVEPFDLFSVIKDLSDLRRLKPEQKTYQRAFSAAGGPDDRDVITGVDPEIHPADDPGRVRRIAEIYVGEFDVSVQMGDHGPVF